MEGLGGGLDEGAMRGLGAEQMRYPHSDRPDLG